MVIRLINSSDRYCVQLYVDIIMYTVFTSSCVQPGKYRLPIDVTHMSRIHVHIHL